MEYLLFFVFLKGDNPSTQFCCQCKVRTWDSSFNKVSETDFHLQPTINQIQKISTSTEPTCFIFGLSGSLKKRNKKGNNHRVR